MTDVADQKISMPLGLRIKLSAMMFLQFMTLPVWFNTIIPYVKTLPGGESWTVWCGMFIGFGTLASPLIGMFADRFLNAEKVLLSRTLPTPPFSRPVSSCARPPCSSRFSSSRAS